MKPHWWNRRAVAAERQRIIELLVDAAGQPLGALTALQVQHLAREIMSGHTKAEIAALTRDELLRIYGLQR